MNLFHYLSILLVFIYNSINCNQQQDQRGYAWEKGNEFEGDILIPFNTRNGIRDTAARWPNGSVPFQITRDFDSNKINMIMEAANIINSVSCVYLHQKKSYERNFIDIGDRNRGCSSYIGYLGEGDQEMNLAEDCFKEIGTVLHEFLHCLGFVHQHSSFERDNYINILWDNIDDQFQSNFMKYNIENVTNFGVKYDTGSVMHYSPYAFSKNGKPTIMLKNSNQIDSNMGQRFRLSESDILKLNYMYNC